MHFYLITLYRYLPMGAMLFLEVFIESVFKYLPTFLCKYQNSEIYIYSILIYLAFKYFFESIFYVNDPIYCTNMNEYQKLANVFSRQSFIKIIRYFSKTIQVPSILSCRCFRNVYVLYYIYIYIRPVECDKAGCIWRSLLIVITLSFTTYAYEMPSSSLLQVSSSSPSTIAFCKTINVYYYYVHRRIIYTYISYRYIGIYRY